MKLYSRILSLARNEADDHFLSDLLFAEELHKFLKNDSDAKSYLSSEFGFKKFLFDYGIGRTLKGGDEAKLKILKLILKFQFGKKNHVQNISSLANIIQQKGLSSNSSSGGPGLPQSFCSKLLYVYKPDEIIPYDAYVLKSLQIRAGQTLKTLDQYYAEADQFRQSHFPESGIEVCRMLDKIDKSTLYRILLLEINPVMLISWKLTDKYLWCEEYVRRKRE